MIKAKVIGAGGYGGVGITELLSGHPEAEITALVDVENTGVPISSLYPHLAGFVDTLITAPDDELALKPADVVFMATPDRVGMKLAGQEIKKGAKIIDYSGDFRFNNVEAYAEYARRIGKPEDHAAPELLANSVYGLPELHRERFNKKTQVVGNPGCFAVSCILGLAPAAKSGIIENDSIICDCKTGVSGAGKKPAQTFHFPERYDTMNAYKLAGHQHVCEIERELSLLNGDRVSITFTSQIVPVCRGIMSTLYGRLHKETSEDKILGIYREFYADDEFVRVYDSKMPLTSAHVRRTNYCNLSVSVNQETRMLRIVSYIDNLVKGQAGSALQNMNLLFGLPENTGLDRPSPYP